MGKKAVVLLSALGTAVLILDTQTAMAGAREGLDLCVRTVIPSLFPFLIFSGMLTSSLMGTALPVPGRLLRRLGIPASAVSLPLVGLVGGYPIGAQAVSDAYAQGALSQRNAQRMIAFCNQAGPSFLFGMVAATFDRKWAGWGLWGIQILSALAVVCLLPKQDTQWAQPPKGAPLSLSAAMTRAVKTMAGICGWVILFRVLIRVLDRWVLWALPAEARIMCCGLLELSNGCCILPLVEKTGTRAVLASLFLSFGGLCVTMQTQSVLSAAKLRLADYLPGKMLQSTISMALTAVLQRFLPPQQQISLQECPFLAVVFVLFLAISMAFMYNQRKTTNRRWNPCFFGKKLTDPANTANMRR